MLLDEFQKADLPRMTEYLNRFWTDQARTRSEGRVVPREFRRAIAKIRAEPLPKEGHPLDALIEAIEELIIPNVVKNGHPLFLAYVTPPSLDIGVLGEAISSILNQNVMFAHTSPIGTAIEQKVVDWLAEIVGYRFGSGGILTSGGSEANLYGLATARRYVLEAASADSGNYAEPRQLRVYCSEYTHRSIDKAAILLGFGRRNVVRIPADENHRILVKELASRIETDLASGESCPVAIIGNAGTRQCCAFDDLQELQNITNKYGLWLHVDAAYGGFLRLANHPPPELAHLAGADSVTINPHKLLFVPFDCGCLLVRDKQNLLNTFGTEGEYRRQLDPASMDFADLGIQLGRSMKALKVWLTLRYVGVERFGREFTRLMDLAQCFAVRIQQDDRLELLGPVCGTAVCFRWRYSAPHARSELDDVNLQIRRSLLREGTAFVDEVQLREHTGIRICMTNFRTERKHLDTLLERIVQLGKTLS